ncbi:MAG: hypothetical protein GY870_04190 [archaeon]|nr:hypothetical protein [archaeon]
MSLLIIITIIFMILELTNVFTLYFKPGLKVNNAVGVFYAWEKSKEYPEIHNLVRYLVYWVAGTKLIFISLLIVILIFGDAITQTYAMVGLLVSIMTFYWKLYPLIHKMDKEDQINPKNYSKVLLLMITCFMIAILIAFISGFLGLN